MKRVSNELFAYTTLATNENGRIAFTNLCDLIVNDLHRLRVANDVGGSKACFQRVLESCIFF